jgi:glutamine amidotransferase PdxT
VSSPSQGDFREHLRLLGSLGASAREVRVPDDLQEVRSLVVPGGESTTMSLLLESSGLLEPLQQLKGTRIPIRVLSWHSAPLPVNIRRWPSLSCTSGSAVP